MSCRVEHDDPSIVGLRGRDRGAILFGSFLKGGQV